MVLYAFFEVVGAQQIYVRDFETLRSVFIPRTLALGRASLPLKYSQIFNTYPDQAAHYRHPMCVVLRLDDS